MIRQTAVAGSFYPADPGALGAQLDSLLDSHEARRKVRAIIVPHAGYVYSGAIAGAVFSRIEIPRRIILIGPNHTGVGPACSVCSSDHWATPFGPVTVAAGLRQRLLESIPVLEADLLAHHYEHSLEVMLPFLLRMRSDVEIVPIILGGLGLNDALTLGDELAKVLAREEEEVLLLASSDMNHFESAAETERLDHLAIAAMEDYAPERLYQVVRDNRITMCGVLPVIAVMRAARRLGASTCELVKYGHSGQVNGDNSRVVGYAGLTIE